jgi:hypothetical protein
MENFSSIVNDQKLNTIEKLEKVFDKGFEVMENNEGVIFYLHTIGNVELHERVEKKFIEHVTPLVVKIVKQGMEEKLFDIEYPEEIVTFLMMGSHFLGDVEIYMEGGEKFLRRLQAVEFVVQRVLGIDSEVIKSFSDKFMVRPKKLFF